MKTILLLLVVIGLQVPLSAQTVTDENTGNKPNEQINVNKEYDENGNLIRYDSVYTWHYSTSNIDSAQMQMFMNQFPGFFNNEMDKFFSENFFDNTQPFFDNFFSDDFFESRFLEQQKEFLQLLQQMDSVKMQFYDNTYNQSDNQDNYKIY